MIELIIIALVLFIFWMVFRALACANRAVDSTIIGGVKIGQALHKHHQQVKAKRAKQDSLRIQRYKRMHNDVPRS